MKKRIDVIASETAYTNLSRFAEIEDLNKTVRAYRDIIKSNVTRKDVQARLIALLEVLKRHSCKQIGVSYMCKNTIASYLNVSYKTVQRLTKKLETLGIIKQIATKRKSDMRQTANAIVIVPFTVEEEVSDKNPTKTVEKCPTKKTTSSPLKQKIKNKRNSNNSTIEYYDYSYVSSNIPERFIQSVKPFFDSASDIYRLWSRLKLAVKNTNATLIVEDNIDPFIKTFKEAIFTYKQNKVRKDLFGFIYGAWRNTSTCISRLQNEEMHNKLREFWGV